MGRGWGSEDREEGGHADTEGCSLGAEMPGGTISEKVQGCGASQTTILLRQKEQPLNTPWRRHDTRQSRGVFSVQGMGTVAQPIPSRPNPAPALLSICASLRRQAGVTASIFKIAASTDNCFQEGEKQPDIYLLCLGHLELLTPSTRTQKGAHTQHVRSTNALRSARHAGETRSRTL